MGLYREKKEAKHLNNKTRKPRRKVLACVLIAELIAAAVFSYVVICSSWEVTARQNVVAELTGFDTDQVTDGADDAYEIGIEQVKEERNETVWTTEEVVYRTGPGEKYESTGTLFEAASMVRTGVTYNDWSQVQIGGEDYYILSDHLTTEEPLITDGGMKGEYERYALSQFGQYGWADEEIRPLIYLWNRESGWNPSSHNRKSGAHGIPQALPAGKMASAGSDYYSNGYTQIRWGLGYIYNRYGSPSNAWRHWQSSGWY
jgi:uncharacterized protein YgiM (DUF1202 family)